MHLLFLPFLIGLVQSIPRKFYLIQQNKTWSDAQLYCRVNHTDLATIESSTEMTELQTVALKQQFSSRAWVGLYKVYHGWNWSFQNETLGSYRTWSPYEPNNYGGIEECGWLYTGRQGWGDVDCRQLYFFLCFDNTMTGTNRFIYYSVRKTWFQAQVYCRQYHTDLATVRTATENTAALGATTDISFFGLHRTSWIWSDQTNPSSIMWAPGQPATAGISASGYFYNGQIFDAVNYNVMPFFCYSVITGQKQIIRMKVQGNQDVNNPTIKALILQQILQKLMDLGVQNVTVRWRQQPDGNVFTKLNWSTAVDSICC